MMAHQTFIVVEYLSARSSWDVKQELVIDLEQGTFHSKESPDQEGRLQLQMACMLALDEEYPQAVPPKAEKDPAIKYVQSKQVHVCPHLIHYLLQH